MRNKVLYLVGSMVSSFGDGIQQIAIIWYIYHLTGEALSIGFMIAIYYLPSIILTPFVSVYVDHHHSKKIVVTTNLLRFLIVMVIAFLILFKIESAWLVYFLQFVMAIGYTVYKPAEQSFIKESFKDRNIPFVISKSTSLNEGALIAGSAAAGVVLLKLSLFISFFINATTFFSAAVSFFFVLGVNEKLIKPKQVNYLYELHLGWKYIYGTRGLRYLLFLSILNSISIQMATAIMLPLAKHFKGGSALYSLYDIAFAAGGIVSGLMAAWLLKKWKQRVLILTMAGMAAVGVILFLNRHAIPAGVLFFFLGWFTMLHLVVAQTLIQLNTSREFIGRVIGLRTILASIVKITSALLTGVFITKLGIFNVFILFSLVILFSFLSIKKLSNVEAPEIL